MSNKSETLSAKDKYEILIKARNFHYENFNKWMTYFYVAIGSMFIGYCTLLSKDKGCADSQCQNLVQYVIPFIGYIISILWFWSSKGYYYWNINFISLVNYYERDILKLPKEERVYFVFSNKDEQNKYYSPISGANISTSKVAILFAYIVTFIWGSLLCFNIISQLECKCLILEILSTIFIVIISTLLLTKFIAKPYLYSKTNHFHDLKLDFDKSDSKNTENLK